ncbi:MAG: TonB family protein [Parvularculaceae bacterium]|nr:TonB family protein [Parvularculaceae bacterium]
MFFRWVFGLPGAALISALLFLGMAYMIRQGAQVGPPVAPPEIKLFPEIEDSKPRPKIPPRDKTLPPPPAIDIPPQEPSRNPRDTIPVDPPSGPTRESGPIVIPGAMQPVVKLPPAYPESCKARGASGVVIVEFDVTAEGNVVNPRIISSADGCFERTVLSTIQKWKYPPPQQDGRAVTQRGVREVFRFELEE